jgi:hypothetical protein
MVPLQGKEGVTSSASPHVSSLRQREETKHTRSLHRESTVWGACLVNKDGLASL